MSNDNEYFDLIDGRKIRKVFNKTIKRTVMERYLDPVSISFVATSGNILHTNLDELDPCFMYTEILKEILLTIEFEEEHVKQFISRCQERFVSNKTDLESINKFENEYYLHTPLYWYTSGNLCSLVNHALRIVDVGLIIKLGFFIRDLLKNIDQVYSEKSAEYQCSGPFKVFRGQSLSQKDLDQLLKSKGGLLAFNQFLSTSRDREIALGFAGANITDLNPTRVLFEITIDPSISKVSFVDVRDISQYASEEEILFSMHSVFRIKEVIPDKNNDFLQVNLTLTDDDDPQLRDLTECIRKETFPQKKGWYRLGEVLNKLGHFDKAQQVCEAMLDQTNDDCEIANIYHLLGIIMYHQDKYEEALGFYRKSLEINEENLSSIHIDIGSAYNNIGLVYSQMGDYQKALESYEEALNICKTASPQDLSKLAICYNNIGLMYEKTREYNKALSMYESALELYHKVFPENHYNIAVCYGNMGKIQNQLDNYTEAFSSHEKAIHICQRSLPSNHPYLAISYYNIALVYERIGHYSNVLLFYTKAREIYQEIFPWNHPDLANLFDNIAKIHYILQDYTNAFSYIKRAIEIAESSLSADHSSRLSYNAGLEMIKGKLNCSENRNNV